MSEGIIIALITAIGSLMGGIIGQSITASATIKAAAIKEKLNLAPDVRGEKSNNWRVILGGAVIGAIATLFILTLLGIFPPPIQIPPTETATYSTPTSKPTTKVSSDPSILFSEDFEDGRAQNFNYTSGNWKIVQESRENKVYEIDNSDINGFSSILTFGSKTWQNYEIQYRVKMLNLIGNDVPEVLLYFAYNDPTGYVLNLQPSSEVADLVPVVSGQWGNGVARHYKYSSNVWYAIRVIAQESTIQVYINNVLIADTDYQVKAGSVEINIGPKAKIQLDDIKVTKVGK